MPTVQEVKFRRKTTAEIEDLEIEDGALIYNVDNGKTYMDYGNERIQTGGNADTMIYVGDEEPTDEDIKLWIETPTSETKASEIVNEYTESDKVGYSTEYANNNFQIKGTILWTNPNPSSDMGNNVPINLSSDDYDLLEVFVIYSKNNQTITNSFRFPKGKGGMLQATSATGTPTVILRNLTYVSDTSFNLTIGKLNQLTSNTVNDSTSGCLPLYIVGYKTGLFE